MDEFSRFLNLPVLESIKIYCPIHCNVVGATETWKLKGGKNATWMDFCGKTSFSIEFNLSTIIFM